MLYKLKDILLQLLPGVLILSIWQFYAVENPKSEFYLGSPSGIAHEFYSSLSNEGLLTDFGVTIFEALLGFIFGISVGTACGLLLWLSKTVYKMAKPYLIILGALPVFALGPILIFWFGTGMLSKVVIGFLSTFVIALVQAYNGATQTNSHLLILVQSFGGTKLDSFKKIVIPSSLIWVMAGVRININMALLGAFVGELISSKGGLGYRIIVAEGLFDVNGIWVGVIGLVVIALIFNLLTLPLEAQAKKRSQ